MSHLATLKGIDSPLAKTDHFFTRAPLFDPLHAEFRFTLDPANHPESHTYRIIPRSYCWPHEDGLKAPWTGERVWLNNPYSQTARWIEKVRAEVMTGCPLVVALLQACKTEQPWWQEHIEPFRDRPPLPRELFSVQTRFLPRRQSFSLPADVLAALNEERKRKGKKPLSGKEAGTFASVLVIWRAL